MSPSKTTRSPLIQPSAAGVLLHFVNTRADAGGRAERFGSAEETRAWMVENTTDPESIRVTEADAARTRQVRDALVTVLLAHSGDKDATPEAIATAERRLRDASVRYPLMSVVTAAGASLVSEQDGLSGVLGTVLASATELAQAGVWERLKACRNQPCHFGFFDQSRNSSAVYCSTQCSSQVSMRAYRQKKKDQAAGTGS